MDKFGETFMYSMSPVLVHIVCRQVTECFLMTYIINLICKNFSSKCGGDPRKQTPWSRGPATSLIQKGAMCNMDKFVETFMLYYVPGTF